MKTAVLITCLLPFCLLLILWVKKFFPKKRHEWYIRRARKIYKEINEIGPRFTDAQLLTFLRQINPYVFEELLLLAFERKGFKVIHNRYYSHDGGIDGHVMVNGKRIPVQAKRYSGYIKGRHVADFTKIVMRKHVPYGFFIHTGRTGNAGYDISSDTVRIISGQKLIGLLREDKGCPYWLQKYKSKKVPHMNF